MSFQEAIELAEKIHTCMDQLKAVGLEPAPKLIEFSGIGDTLSPNDRYNMTPLDKLNTLTLQTKDHMDEIKKLKKENAQLMTQKAKLETNLLDRVTKLEDNYFTPQPKQYNNRNDRYNTRNYDRYPNRSGENSNNRGMYQGNTFNNQQRPPQRPSQGPPQRPPPFQGPPRKGPSTFNKPMCSYCHTPGHLVSNCWARDPTTRHYQSPHLRGHMMEMKQPYQKTKSGWRFMGKSLCHYIDKEKQWECIVFS
jgi:hypothetical protein